MNQITIQFAVLGAFLSILILRQKLLEKPVSETLLLCGDQHSPGSLAFYFDYQYPEHLRVFPLSDPNGFEPYVNSRTYVFLHIPRSEFLSKSYRQRIFTKTVTSLPDNPIFQEDGVVLYRCGDPAALMQTIRRPDEPNPAGKDTQ